MVDQSAFDKQWSLQISYFVFPVELDVKFPLSAAFRQTNAFYDFHNLWGYSANKRVPLHGFTFSEREGKVDQTLITRAAIRQC